MQREWTFLITTRRDRCWCTAEAWNCPFHGICSWTVWSHNLYICRITEWCPPHGSSYLFSFEYELFNEGGNSEQQRNFSHFVQVGSISDRMAIPRTDQVFPDESCVAPLIWMWHCLCLDSNHITYITQVQCPEVVQFWWPKVVLFCVSVPRPQP